VGLKDIYRAGLLRGFLTSENRDDADMWVDGFVSELVETIDHEIAHLACRNYGNLASSERIAQLFEDAGRLARGQPLQLHQVRANL